jgi:hypothetical protein
MLIAPLGWVLMALAITGNPWYTVGAQKLGGPTTPAPVHFSAWRQVSAMMDALRKDIRAPALLGAVAGLLLALRLRRWRVALPALISVLVLLTYGAFVVLGLAVPDRMLLLPGVMLTLFCGFAVVGWRGCRSKLERGVWAAVGIAVVAILLADGPRTINGLRGLVTRTSGQQQVLSDLDALRDSAASQTALRSCRPISLGAGGLAGFVAYYLDLPLRRLVVTQGSAPARGAYLAPANWNASQLIVTSQYARQADYVPPGFQRAAGNRSWTVYTKGC